MVWRHPLASPIKLLALFVVLAGIPLVALGWLGYQVIQQDRALESQRLRDRLDNAATLVAGELDRGLTAWEELLAAAARGEAVSLPPAAVFLLVGTDGVVQQRGVALPYYPRVAQTSAAASPVFAAAEVHEFQDGNLAAAIAAYRDLASSRDERIRAEALVRLARCLRKQQKTDEALVTYAGLIRLVGVTVAGAPAELVARRERIMLFTARGQAEAASQDRALLSAALADGRFRIDRPTFEYFKEAAPLANAPTTRATLPLAAAVDALWPAWMDQTAGRQTWSRGAATFVSVWRATAIGKASITAPIDGLTALIDSSLRNLRITAQLDDRAGTPIWGRRSPGPRVTRTARETGLPWTLHVTASDAPAGEQIADSRRNLLVAGFGLMALVILGAGYFVFRAVAHELAVARLQSEFVAAVSHEFRTPLTAMCHLTEMLEDGGASPDRLGEYYGALGRESRRLHTMVENLLDFGRMDSGRRTYEFAPVDPIDLIDRVAREYADRSPGSAVRIETSLPSPGHHGIVIRADREALALALRNLLDNAMKYSPESSPIRLGVVRQNGAIALSVEDRGAGITDEDRRAIFRKFMRGTAARTLNVRGTGIGLTMTDQIVKAHGGRLEVKSEPGRGSTFTILLPAQA